MAEQDAAAIARAAWDRGEDAAFHGDIATGRTWLERAHRFASSDQNLALALALMRLRDGSAMEAASLFRSIAATHGGREAWVGLAHCALALHDADGARGAIGRLLAAYAAGPDIAALAQRLVAAGGATSWCGLSDKGVLMGDWDPDALVVMLAPGPLARRVAAFRRRRRCATLRQPDRYPGHLPDGGLRRRRRGPAGGMGVASRRAGHRPRCAGTG